jgi:acyl-CoA oxidase
MFARFAKVTPEGTYVPPPPANSKASYATMLYVRADIVKNAGGVLAKATTIATRYAAVRRQTAPAPGGWEEGWEGWGGRGAAGRGGGSMAVGWAGQ